MDLSTSHDGYVGWGHDVIDRTQNLQSHTKYILKTEGNLFFIFQYFRKLTHSKLLFKIKKSID